MVIAETRTAPLTCAAHKEIPDPPAALDRAAALFLDLDGTLLEIAPRPELVRVPAHLPALLDRLARQRDGALAVVSGRRIADLDRLLQPWRGAAAGLHGGERRRPDGSHAETDSAAARDAVAALDRLRPQLAEAVRRWPGVRLEDKDKTLAIHYREAPAYGGEVGALAETMRQQGGDALRLIAGKMVFELQPLVLGKDGAIAAFMAEEPFRGRLSVFLGDDTTDEDGFAEVNRRGGMSIRVGEPLPGSRARCVLPSVTAVLAWLAAGSSA